MKKSLIRHSICALLVTGGLLHLAAASENTNEVFVTYRKTQNSFPVTKAQLDAAKNAKESLPASADPEGHWGSVVEGFQLSARLEKKSFKPDEQIKVTVLLRNTTNHVIGYSAFFGSGVDLPICDFVVTRTGQTNNLKKQNLETEIATGGARWFNLHPQTQRKYEATLNGAFDLTIPGDYSVYAEGFVPDLNGKGHASIKSEAATFTIVK